MKNYLQDVPEYAKLLFIRVDTVAGILVGIGVFFLVRLLGLSDGASFIISAGVIALAMLEAGYALWRQERVMRIERERLVTLMPRLKASQYTITMEKELSIDASVGWEIWAKEPVWTDEIALVLSVKENWQRFKFFTQTTVTRLVRLPPDVDPEIGVDSWYREHYQYRNLVSQDAQPLKGSAQFHIKDFWVGDEPRPTEPVVISKATMKGRRHRKGFLEYSFELVLNTRSPEGEYRAPVAIDRMRGAELAKDVT